MQFFEYKELRKSIVALSRKGASFAKAAEKADSLIGKVAREDKDPLAGFQKTSHGENRITNCVKYDLCGRSRLVTVQTNKSCLLLFVGDHNTVDKWLDRKKGISFARDKANQLVEVTSKSTVIGESEPRVEYRLRQDEPLVSLLDEDLLDRFLDTTPRKVQRELDRLTSFDESKLYEITAELEPSLAKAIKDAFLSLITGEVKDAIRVIELFLGDIQPVEEIDINSIVVDSEFLKKLSQDALQYPALLRKFAETSDYKDWMLYMHPDQEAIAFAEFNGTAKLLGVSGSGKTCVIVQRAIFLARKYENEKILVVTLNKPLAALIETLITKLADSALLPRITVKPFFRICQELLLEFEPENNKLFEDITWKSGEHIDEIWREFYRCELNFDEASVLYEVHDSLISRSIDAESYIREEFDWIRSAFPVHRRNEYLDVKRQGRTISMNEKYREKMLLGLSSWEKKMRHIGVTDYLNLSTALYAHIDKIKNRYRSILIDESQDFGGIEFEIARRLVNPNPNDLFICGDAAQKVSTKYQNLKSAGINLHSSRSKKITKNYRNSREILELANSVLNENLSIEMLESDEFEILDPEYASFSGSACSGPFRSPISVQSDQ